MKIIDRQPFQIQDLDLWLKDKIGLAEEQKQKIIENHNFLLTKVRENKPIYGVNTGFGALCDTLISTEDLSKLQEKLIQSHAVGVGDVLPKKISKTMLLFKILGLAKGYSGVSIQLIEKLIHLYNTDLIPMVYEQGSLGASGDLAPLAHLALPIIGEGKLWYGEDIKEAKDLAFESLKLHPKEGLALINGTQFMSAHGAIIIHQAKQLFQKALTIACLSLEAFQASQTPFYDINHQIRPHNGQKYVANKILELLSDSKLFKSEKNTVQDPYSFRCIPQVLGASWDAIQHVESIFSIEINSVTDNPNIFEKENAIYSAGNFHGQPLSISLDYLAIALAEIGSISERRSYKLLNGLRNLPPFLIPKPGLDSGYMILQYTAASLVSQNKQLCTPSSVDTIDSSNGQEDHVSMGANAATKVLRVLKNLEHILSIEYLLACQAIDFRETKNMGTATEHLYQQLRAKVPFAEEDRLFEKDMIYAHSIVIH